MKSNTYDWLMDTDKCQICGKKPKYYEFVMCDTKTKRYGHVKCFKNLSKKRLK